MTPLPATVTTPRLRLELIGPDDARAITGGHRDPAWHPDYPRRDDLAALSMVDAGAVDLSWGPRHVVRAYDGLVVGSIGFFGPPVDGADGPPEVEIGYGLVEDARGRGVATEAVAGLLEHADRAGVRVRARFSADNPASLRVLAKCGFTDLRPPDEDGNLVLGRPVPTGVARTSPATGSPAG